MPGIPPATSHYEDDDGTATPSTRKSFAGESRVCKLLLYAGVSLGLVATIVIPRTAKTAELATASAVLPYIDIAAWILIVMLVVSIHCHEQQLGRSYITVCGATTVLISIVLNFASAATSKAHRPQLGTFAVSPKFDLPCLQLLAAALAMFGFVSTPLRPRVFSHGRPVDPQNAVSLLQKYTFGWAATMIHTAQNEPLQLSDLPVLECRKRSRIQHSKFMGKAVSGRLVGRLLSVHAYQLLVQLSLTLLKALLASASPYIIYRFLQTLEKQTEERTHKFRLYIWVAGLGTNLLFEVVIANWLQWWTSSQLELPVRALLSTIVFEKAMKLPNAQELSSPMQMPKKGPGDRDRQPPPRPPIINHMKLDSGRIAMFCLYNYQFPLAIIQLVLTSMFLKTLLGWKSLLAGLFASFAVTPMTRRLSEKTAAMQFELSKYRDLKTSLLSEALQNIRQIRYMAAEKVWENKILRLREEELQHAWKGNIIMFFLVLFVDLGPLLIAAVSLSAFALQDGKLTPSVAFTALGLIERLKDNLGSLPLMGSYLWEAWASCTRLETFLSQPERENKVIPADAVTFKDVNVSWPLAEREQSGSSALKDINLKFPVGKLSIITGRTGSGKSLLLASVVGEAEISAGQLRAPTCSFEAQQPKNLSDNDWILPASVAFVSQPPWIESVTIKENILFGLPLQQSRYDLAISSCALQEDLKALPDGDKTEAGPRGVALSGGQRWRIALARALYSRAETIVLDDVLSAVDSRVGRWIIDKSLCGPLCETRTRILATYIPLEARSKVTYRVFVDEGTVTSSEVMEIGDAKQEKSTLLTEAENESAIELEHKSLGSQTSSEHPTTSALNRTRTLGQNGNLSRTSDTTHSKLGSCKAYLTYFQASGGWAFWTLAVGVILGYQLISASGAWWLKLWARNYNTNQLESQQHSIAVMINVAVYLSISVLTSVASATQALVLYSSGMNASRALYKKMTYAVLRARLRWIDTVPNGQILNVFIADFNTIDRRLALDFGFSLEFLFRLAVILATSLVVSPYILMFALGLLFFDYSIVKQYWKAAKSLRKLSAASNSNILDHFISVTSGLATIRAFGRTQFYTGKMHDLTDDNLRSGWHLALVIRWMEFRLGALGALLVTAVAIAILLEGENDAATAGFAITFALQFTKAVTGILRKAAAAETGFDAVGRVAEYFEIPTESHNGRPAPDLWPMEGRIEVRNLVATYDESLPPVLKGLSFSVAPCQRVGVVGRTGAGKSSLANAFLRFIEPSQGSIYIDGIDIAQLQLYDLRSRICIIPQDPFLFSGTLRDNLDIEGSRSDDDIRSVLAQVQLIKARDDTSARSPKPQISVEGKSDKFQDAPKSVFDDLHSSISDGGSNISHGQRQLICLARAILTKPKIILLDEATSSIDPETDIIIQRVLRTELINSTRIVIAHRLSTIADFDKILVMDQGKISESGSPAELLHARGLFWELVGQSSDRESLEATICKSI